MNSFCRWLTAGLIGFVSLFESTNAFASSPRRFREPQSTDYYVEEQPAAPLAGRRPEWVKAHPAGDTNSVEIGSTIVLQLKSPSELRSILKGTFFQIARELPANTYILDCGDALTAIDAAEHFSSMAQVEACYPVMKRPADLHSRLYPYPNDPFFVSFLPTSPTTGINGQWYLENKTSVGVQNGVDINARTAWPYAMGENTTIAVVDLGVDLGHLDLVPRVTGRPHYNFARLNTNGTPALGSTEWAHGTEVAGLAAADLNNNRGLVGVAPKAGLASFVIFETNRIRVADDRMMDAYQYASNSVTVQNHSWGAVGLRQQRITLLEDIGISNAVAFGRSGKGVLMVRSAGNDRSFGASADDDGYPSDPRAITVAAVRRDGRVTSYSEPGACVLVAAPSGDMGFPNLFTSDISGTLGVNQIFFFNDLADYAYNSLGFSGTSASAPLVSGMAALLVSANTNLSYRDVQQILILASQQVDSGDPDIAQNGAGFRVSHNTGFGVPDAGEAVRLAKQWINRPAQTNVAVTLTNLNTLIPDAGLRVSIIGENLPPGFDSIVAVPSLGPHVETATLTLPLVDVGFATNQITQNLTNKVALIQRGTNSFAEKIDFAAAAGASFVVIYNDSPTNTPFVLGTTDFTTIPAVLIPQAEGQAIRDRLATNASLSAQIVLDPATFAFNVTNTVLCEHIGLRISAAHPSRGDLRITLTSPQGTRSVLQRLNSDTNAGPADWTFWTTHHFYESSAGTWTVSVADEYDGDAGAVTSVELKVTGVAINDADHDGLDDAWETTSFGSLAYGAKDDPDKDGYNNGREQVLQTNPLTPVPFQLDFSKWNSSIGRLSWPASTNYNYQVWGGTNVANMTLLTNLPGRFPEVEWLYPATNVLHFFRVQASLAP